MAKSNIAQRLPRQGWHPQTVLGALVLACAQFTAGSVLAQSGELKLKEGAPDRYIVEKGDTLWGIASKFLQDPWRWSELWRMNQEQVKNPNRIYPGNVIVLERSAGKTPQVVLQETVKLSPELRTESLADQAIPAIPANVIEPFLTQPLVIEANGLEKAPRIVATQEDRVYMGAGGTIYVSGLDSKIDSLWQVYRPGKPLIDPTTKAVLGHEAVFLGTARLTRTGEPATMQIVSSRQEISRGDRLVAIAPAMQTGYQPHAPSRMIRGQIIGMYDGLATSETGRNSVVAINLGKRDGLEVGHVFAVVRTGATVVDPSSSKSRDTAPTFKLPDERYGLIFVFRVFDAVSYALVMESTRQVVPADIIQTP